MLLNLTVRSKVDQFDDKVFGSIEYVVLKKKIPNFLLWHLHEGIDWFIRG